MSETSAEHRADPEQSPRDERAAGETSAARETIASLGDRARGIVEELARHARERRDEAARAGEPPPFEPGTASDAFPAELPHRLGELRACVGEVADVLEATLERLETVESQLGDPDESVERTLAAGIARCERVLMGIEHRIEGSMSPPAGPREIRVDVPARPQALARPVLVVARSSRRRADLCVAVERRGLAAVAAYDLATAIGTASRSSPCAAVIALDGAGAESAAFLAQWNDYRERGALPPAAVLGVSEADARRHEIELVMEEHGDAALAAVLVRLARGDAPAD